MPARRAPIRALRCPQPPSARPWAASRLPNGSPAARRVDLVRLTLDLSETDSRDEAAKVLSERFATAVKGLGLANEDELQTRVSALESFDEDLGPFEVSLYADIADPDRFHLVLDREQNPLMMSAVRQ